MPFLPLIPQATDQLSISQGNILNNFTILGAIAGNANASSASINTNAGFNWIYLPAQGATPPAAAQFPAGDVGLYSFTNATTGRNELYINHTIAGPTIVQTPMTAYGVSGNQGWTYLPSGVKMIWGRGLINPGQQVTITYNNTALGGINGFPGFQTQATPVVSRLRTGASTTAEFVYVDTASSLTQLVVDSSGAFTNYAFYWHVIGI